MTVFSSTASADGEYLRQKEAELERCLRQADELRELILALRRFQRMHSEREAVTLPSSERKRPSREDRVKILLRSGAMSLDTLARAFKLRKSEMREWMDARSGKSTWSKTADGKSYALAR